MLRSFWEVRTFIFITGICSLLLFSWILLTSMIHYLCSLYIYIVLPLFLRTPGLVIWRKPEWHIIDPILTLGFCVLVLWSTIGVLRSSIAVLLEETPAGIDWRKVYTVISAVPNVDDVHVSNNDMDMDMDMDMDIHVA